MDINWLIKPVRNINDSIYGTIQLTNFAVKIIDTIEFQRLRNMKQLSTCNYIFQNAVHTRFEHSIGTYYLSQQLTSQISIDSNKNDINNDIKKNKYIYEYLKKTYLENNRLCKFDKYLQELINIAALCHDIGHGPFSHIFDDDFLNIVGLQNHQNATHEKRSCLLLDNIIKKSSILSSIIPSSHIQFIQTIINPDEHCNGFLYQIVSNNFNGLDIDKIDYLTRDTKCLGMETGFDYRRIINYALESNDIIIYPEQCAFDIYNVFCTRHKMHNQVYTHKGVISSHYMIIELLLELDKIIDIKKSLDDLDFFCKLTDNYIMEYPKFLKLLNNNSNKKIDDLSNRLNTHNLYSVIGKFISKNIINLDKSIIFKKYPKLLDDVIIFSKKIGFVGGNKKHPFENIIIYKTKDMTTSKITKITNIIPEIYQEYIYIVFYKEQNNDSNIIQQLKKCYNNYIKNNFD